MKIARFLHNGGVRHGIVSDDRILPVTDSRDLDAVTIAGWDSATVRRNLQPGGSIGCEEVTLLPPVQPVAFRDYITFEQHLAGVMRGFSGDTVIPQAWFDAPAFYFSNPHAFIGSGHPVSFPPGCRVFDFEVELAAVIGRDATDLTPAQATEAIVGYTVLNDWSARDLQRPEMTIGLGPVKGKDSASTLGPWLVTADELETHRVDDRIAVEGSVWVNGTLVGRDTFAHMAWSFGEMIAYASRGALIRRGDVFGSGTMGYGCLAESWGRHGPDSTPQLAVGDVVSIEIDAIGRISSQLIASEDPHPLPPARRIPTAQWAGPIAQTRTSWARTPRSHEEETS